MERREVKLTPEEEDIRRPVFRDLPPRKVLQVLSIGSWTTLEVGQRLIEKGKLPETVSLIARVHQRVERVPPLADPLHGFARSALGVRCVSHRF